MSRQYLDVPYRSKDAAKALGARFDGAVKRWYVEAGADLIAFSAWLPAGTILAAAVGCITKQRAEWWDPECVFQPIVDAVSA